MSKTLRNASGSAAATERRVATTLAAPDVKTCAASRAESQVDSADGCHGNAARETRPLCDSSQRPSVNGAHAVSSGGMLTVAERTAASTAPDVNSGATD